MAQGEAVLNVAQAELRPTLRFGDGGAVVSELQGMLSLLGYYPNPVDGRFDENTEAAVQAFQTDVGLIADGIVGPVTWQRLLPTPSTEFTPPAVAVAPATPTPQPAPVTAPATSPEGAVDLPVLRFGTHGPAVTRLQTRLQALGFYSGALDGIFGAQTENAVRAFQQDVQILTDGIVGPATWTALLR
jgi:peptidoglycan hydrolase-like protein with peptidoglycan-binding domain